MEKSVLLDDVIGTVYNVQRFSLHDGPGIRTTVFMKGCPLHCDWCSNPESQNFEIEMMGDEKVGYQVSVKKMIEIIIRDKPFYNRTKGGLTISGGEPLAQYNFVLALVKKAKENNINTAIETCVFQQWQNISEVLELIDTVYIDIKSMDDENHQQVTGVSNKLILENIKKIAQKRSDIIIRIPIIPGINDSYDNLLKTAEFCKENNIKKIELLPYHPMGAVKYKKLNRNYKMKDLKIQDKGSLEPVAKKLRSQIDINVEVV